MSLLQSQLLQEHLDHEEGARYDDIRERYASGIEDMRHWAEADEEHYKYMQAVYDAGFGEDADAYEANWKRTEKYIDSIAVGDVKYLASLLDNWVRASADMHPKLCPDAWAIVRNKIMEANAIYVRMLKQLKKGNS